MSHLTADEKKRYDFLSNQATRRALTAAEHEEWRGFGERYAVQMIDERQEYIARRQKDMVDFLAEKKAYDDAKAADSEFAGEPVERDFQAWLIAKERV
jgi:hypothetical protein